MKLAQKIFELINQIRTISEILYRGHEVNLGHSSKAISLISIPGCNQAIANISGHLKNQFYFLFPFNHLFVVRGDLCLSFTGKRVQALEIDVG